ncbi:MAG TPA: hypothetical protein VIG99_14500 [Myxococcaceae bacterium]
MCFEKVKAPDPVFDFYYDFDRVDGDYLQRLGAGGNWAIDGELLEFIQDHLPKGSAGIPDPTKQVNIVARITLESYYATLDESGSPVSKSARALVEEGRHTAFFSACGFFYVRSLRYSSTFMALFQFAGLPSDEDERLEQMLRAGLFELGSGQSTGEMERLAQALGMKIFVRGVGLGHSSKLANLVPTNLKELRQSIESAAELMQAATSGRIIAMEIAPWIEHPDLRSFFFSKPVPGESTFGRSQNMELNSQVVTAINQGRAHLLEEYYLSSLCRRDLLEYYPIEKSDYSGHFDVVYDPQRTTFQNHHHPNEVERRITLQEFRDYFEKYPPRVFLEKANRFMYGAGGHEGAEGCVTALLKEGLDRADFTKFKPCVDALRNIEVQDRFLRNFCLPTPVTRVYKAAAP